MVQPNKVHTHVEKKLRKNTPMTDSTLPPSLAPVPAGYADMTQFLLELGVGFAYVGKLGSFGSGRRRFLS